MQDHVDDAETVEISRDKFRRLVTDNTRQIGAESWKDVIRKQTESLQARPVDTQDGLEEGERIESDEWLIREPNGDTYVVSDETFTDEFEFEGSTHTATVMMDLSTERIEREDGPDIAGKDITAELTVTIDKTRDVVTNFDIEAVHYEDYTVDGGLPIEVLLDHRLFDYDG